MQIFKNSIVKLAAVGLLVFMCASDANAQCEPPGTAATAASASASAQTAAVTALTATFVTPGTGSIDLAVGTANATITNAMNLGWTMMLARLDKFWKDWFSYMQASIKQEHSSIIDQTRQMASNYDTSSVNEAAKRMQSAQYEARKAYQVTDEGCRFDTTATYQGSAMARAKGLATAVTQDIRKMGGNKAGTPAANGRGGFLGSRVAKYVAKFCDPDQNAGNAGCAAAGSMPDAHILPSRTIFGKETIDFSDADTADAVNELVLNITGYEVPDPMPLRAMSTPAGQEQIQINREYQARMDVATSLVMSPVGERTPGAPAPEIKALRVRQGVADASANPSEREIRQRVIEELWDPKFYINLGGSPTTIAQKEVFLDAYNLMLVYKMVEKMEKISTAYAIQAANTLEKYDRSRGLPVAPQR